MRFAKILLILCSTCFSVIWAYSEINATTTTEFIQALRPTEGRTRGLGGTAPGSRLQKSHEMDIPLRFATNSATLRSDAIEELNRLSRALQEPALQKYMYLIEGHTCDLGDSEHNMELSRRRAYAVANYLTANTTLSPVQFEARWFGESRPTIANTDENSRKNNRRVIIKNTRQTINAALLVESTNLQIFHHLNDMKEIVADGDTLQSGAKYTLAFKTTDKPYVYICQVDSNGNANLLFPGGMSTQLTNPVTLGTTYHIPGNNELFYLDQTTGKEQLIFLALQAPADRPLQACMKNHQAQVANNAKQRGLGGISSLPPAESAISVRLMENNSTQLCEIMAGGKTRGLAGIKRYNPESGSSLVTVNSIPQDNTCRGYLLKRFFNHK